MTPPIQRTSGIDTLFAIMIVAAILLVLLLLLAIARSIVLAAETEEPTAQAVPHVSSAPAMVRPETMPVDSAGSDDARTGPPTESSSTPEPVPPKTSRHRYLLSAGRSPMPHSGEVISEPIRSMRLDPTDQFGTAQPESCQVITWQDAYHYLGHDIVIEGKVEHTGVSEGRTLRFLNFDQDWRNKFYIVVMPNANLEWPEPAEKYFLNKTIRIRGTVTMYRGNPQIRVDKASQITVVSKTSSSAR